jgi:endonuclease G, mitochondrial
MPLPSRGVNYKALLKGQKDPAEVLHARPVEVSHERMAEFDANRRALADRLDPFKRRKKPWGGLRAGAANNLRALWPEYRRTAEAYRTRRDLVRRHVREMAGPGDLIIVGYSLGSVVAADLLPFLRPDQHVRLLVTLGSPLGITGSWERTAAGLDPFPYDRLDAWVNIHNTSDAVTGWVGLERRIRDVVDVPIGDFGFGLDPDARHKIRGYARHAALAAAVAWAVE